jgi:polysaccharide biosynthesis transport protein
MSRDMQLYSQTLSYGSNLPVAQDDLAHQTTALGMPGVGGGNTAPPPPSPMRKIQRLLRGREKLAITLGLCGAIVGGLVGWFSQKPQWISSGTVWIRPIIPRLLDSDKVMPFYTQYIQSQCAILVGPRVLDRAVQSNDWKATGLPSNSDMAATLKQNLDVSSPKNSQHIIVSYIDERDAVAHAAVRSVIHAYESIYSDANGQEMKQKIGQIEAKKDELESAIRGIQGQMRALTDKHGSDDLKVVYDESMKHLMQLRDQVRGVQLKLDAAKATLAKQEGIDPAAALSPEIIAQNDPTMRQYLANLDTMTFQLQQLARSVGVKNPTYLSRAAEVEDQKQRIATYAEAYRKQFNGGKFFDPFSGQITLLSKDMFDNWDFQAGALQKQLDKEEADNNSLTKDWSQMLDLKQQLERFRTEKEKYDRQYDEQLAQAAMGGTLQVVSDGDTPIPAPDKRKQFAFVGFMGGAGLPIGIILLWGLLDPKLRYSEEAGSDMSGMTLLGILPNLPDRLTDPAQAATAAHCVHQIRTMLQINSREDHNVFAVTSASPGDGKTSLTLALGLSFAASGSRTLLIDCDLVGAGLTARLDMGGPDGVLEAMANRDLLPFVRPTDISDLSMLPVGQAQAHHAGMFSPAALKRMLTEAKKHFEIVLIDSGPVLGSIEATPVCAAADGVILTVSRGQQRPLVEKAMQHLMSIGARFAGVVFNRAQARDFARSISGISLRSIARHQQSTGVHPGDARTNGNGNGSQRTGGKAFGPVARAVASSVKAPGETDAAA